MRSFVLPDLPGLGGLLMPPAFGQDDQVRAPMLIANEMRPESRDRLASPLVRPETRDRLARPVQELSSYRQQSGQRPDSRDPLARPVDEVRIVRPELIEAERGPTPAGSSPVGVLPADQEARAALPAAFSAVPLAAPAATPVLRRTTRGHAGDLGLSQYLSAPWQQATFVAGLVSVASLLFWRLGKRARHAPHSEDKPVPAGQRFRGADHGQPDARYATLREAIDAMKAAAAARN